MIFSLSDEAISDHDHDHEPLSSCCLPQIHWVNSFATRHYVNDLIGIYYNLMDS